MAALQARYAGLQVRATLAPFFEHIPSLLAQAHLLIGRAGASTVAEVLAAGVPAVLIPLPSAADDHQTANAKSVEAAGAGWCLPQSQASTQTLLQLLETDGKTLAEMSAKARSFARIDAVKNMQTIIAPGV